MATLELADERSQPLKSAGVIGLGPGKINYAYSEGAQVINPLVEQYATEHNVQNPPLDGR